MIGVVARQAAGAGANPEPALIVHIQGQDEAVRERARGLGVGGVAAKVIAVPTGEAALGGEPDETGAILDDGGAGGRFGVGMVSEESVSEPCPARRRWAGDTRGCDETQENQGDQRTPRRVLPDCR